MSRASRMLAAIRARLRRRWYHRSYSQCGEDRIVQFLLFEVLRRKTMTYVDIGAHDPWFLSNTALFYDLGFQGICVEPDPAACRAFARARPRDTCVNAGVAPGPDKVADLYVFGSRALTTFSKQQADHCIAEGHTLQAVVRAPLLSANELFQRYAPAPTDFLSIDVEGLDLEILKDMDLDRHRPTIACVETLSFSSDRRQWRKSTDTIRLMTDRGYFVYADTHLNTIFVRREVW